MNIYIELMGITFLFSTACAILGPFLILQKKSMMVDAMSHTILLGIVLGYFFTKNLNSPLLILFASFTGVFTSFFIESFSQIPFMEEDRAIGTVFPLFFSIAIIIISIAPSTVHLDVDSVLLGKIEFATLERWIIQNRDFGAKAMWMGLLLCFLNILFIRLFYKELKVTTFDRQYAKGLYLSVPLLQTLFMLMISLTTVASFQAIGSILVISFLVGPCVTAYFFTKDLKQLIKYSILISMIDTLIGFCFAILFDLSISGTISTIIGFVFVLIFLFHPKKGVFYQIHEKRKKRSLFIENLCLFHIYTHSCLKNNAEIECHCRTMNRHHLHLPEKEYEQAIQSLQSKLQIKTINSHYEITKNGTLYLQKNFSNIYHIIKCTHL